MIGVILGGLVLFWGLAGIVRFFGKPQQGAFSDAGLKQAATNTGCILGPAIAIFVILLVLSTLANMVR